MGTTPLIVATCVLLSCASQRTYAQEEDTVEACPSLTSGKGSVQIQCSADGEAADCDSPKVGTIAQTVWKKGIIKQRKGLAKMVCKPGGIWGKAPPAPKVIPDDYVKYRDLGYYKLYTVPAPYDVAEQKCKLAGARIMSVDSAEKQALAVEIKEADPKFMDSYPTGDIFAGMTNREDPLVFKTIYGTRADTIPNFSDKNWKAEPNYCVVYSVAKFLYWACPCAETRKYVCEIKLST